MQAIRYSLRQWWRYPGFAAIAIVTLALGIGANSAIFSFVNAILLKRLPVPHPERLVTFGEMDRGERRGVVWPLPDIDDLAKRSTEFDGVFGWFSRPISFATSGKAEWVEGEMVTGQYFHTLQAQPAIGRLFDEDDVRNAQGNPVCVLSYTFWQREFAGEAGMVGRTISLNGHPYRVLGVTARGFNGATLQQRFDIAVPATRVGDFMAAFNDTTGSGWLKRLSWMTPMARLKPGVSRVEAQTQLQHDSANMVHTGAHIVLDDGSQGLNPMRSTYVRPVLVLMAVAALVLLVACANLANLLLARAQARAKEFAVRLSIGASRAALVRQLLIESFLLAAGGGLAGIALAYWINRTLLSFLNTGRSEAAAVHIGTDVRVLAFSIALSFLTAILFGLAPAWQATRPDLLPGLQHDSSGGGPPHRTLLRRGLVVIQVALSLVIVFAAGLLTRTLGSLAAVDLGFQPERIIVLNVDPAANGHSAAETSAIFDELLRQARAVPGVKAASLALSPPEGNFGITNSIDAVPGYVPRPGERDIAYVNPISSDYFATLGQSLLRGRDFDQRDTQNSQHVAILNQAFVRHYFGGREPLGGKIKLGGGADLEIAGVVSDAHDQGARKSPQPTVYLPERQSQNSGLTLLVRTALDPGRVTPALLGIVHRIDPHLPVYSVHTLDVDIQKGLSTERILGVLSMLFGALATLLAGVGLYGVMAYSVARRTHEIGVRFAIGAQRRDVASLFAEEGFALVLIGLAIGAPSALISARALRSLLFGVAATDPLTLLLSVGTLTLAAVLAISIPLWRAARVDPMIALRHQ